MFNSTFNHLKTVVKEGFSLVKTVTVGTINAVGQDLSKAKQTADEFKQFLEWKKQQGNDKK